MTLRPLLFIAFVAACAPEPSDAPISDPVGDEAAIFVDPADGSIRAAHEFLHC